jgi:hypothetical protein
MIPRRTFLSRAALACAGLALPGWTAAKDPKEDKDKAALDGVWTKKEGEVTIEFIDEKVLTVAPHGKAEVLLIRCKYTVDKKGRVQVRITELEGDAKEKAKDAIPVGTEFSFRWSARDDAATLDGVKGEKVEAFKSHLEGKYDKK